MKGQSKIILPIMLAFLLAGCSPAEAVGSGIGSFVLLESRNPDYYEHLSPQKGFSFHIPEGMEMQGRTKNLILSSSRYLNHDGFSAVLQEDGSVTISGVNEEKKVFLLVADGVVLEPGSYTLSDGGVSAADGSYYMSVTLDNQAIAALPGSSHIYLTEPCEVGVYISVEPGIRLNEVTFYPEISLKEEEDDVFDPCPDAVEGASGSGTRGLLFRVDRELLKQFSDDDRILFDNNLAYMYKGRFEWVSLMFEDGTGVQIVDCDPDKALYGKMDIYGRVWETF